MRFGDARLYRSDVGFGHKMQYRLMGLADPSQYLRAHYFKKYTDKLDPRLILDAGCGGGDYSFYMAERWPEARVRAVDLSGDSISKNKEVQRKWSLSNIDFEVADLEGVCEKEQYDLIVCVDVLEHIVDQERVLSNLCAALRDGGHLYLHLPLKRPRPEPLKKHLKEFHEWAEREHKGVERTGEELLSMIERARFQIIRNQRTFCYVGGELACSLFAAFFKNTMGNRIAQGLMFPVTRSLCFWEMMRPREEGYALAVLCRKHARA